MNFVLSLIIPLLMASEFKVKEIYFNNSKSLVIEVADTNSLRSQGLMHRTKLEADKGMLFIFDIPERLSFWNKNTFIPLSIGYFDENKVLKEIHNMESQNIMERHQEIKSYPSQCLCRYALEVNQGWFKINKIKIGDRFSFLRKKSNILDSQKK